MGCGYSSSNVLDEKDFDDLCTVRPDLKGLDRKDAKLTIKRDLQLARHLMENSPLGYEMEKSECKDASNLLSGLLGSVGHVCVVVKNADVSFKFYHHVLGLRLLNRPKFASNGYWLWMGNCMLHLIQSDVTVRPDPVNAGTRVNHISFNVYNFKECEDRLREAKIEYQKVYVPVASGNGINQLFFQDPDYHWIELCDCQRFNDFVFGAYDEIRAEELADFYAEGGTEGKNILVAALLLLFMCWPKPEGHESYIFFNVFKFLAGDDMQLSTSELFNVFRKMSPTISSKATSMFFASLDASGDGNISFSEFISFLKSEIIPVPAEELAEPVFSILDRDATGHITVTEIVDAVQSLNVPKSSDERIHKVFADIDIDSSGSIDIHEFRKFFISFHKELRDLLYTSAGSVKFDENSDF